MRYKVADCVSRFGNTENVGIIIDIESDQQYYKVAWFTSDGLSEFAEYCADYQLCEAQTNEEVWF